MNQKEVRRLINNGTAKDIVMASMEELKELKSKGIHKVELSYGVYGMNGGLFKDDEGNLYGIVGRASNLFYLI